MHPPDNYCPGQDIGFPSKLCGRLFITGVECPMRPFHVTLDFKDGGWTYPFDGFLTMTCGFLRTNPMSGFPVFGMSWNLNQGDCQGSGGSESENQCGLINVEAGGVVPAACCPDTPIDFSLVESDVVGGIYPCGTGVPPSVDQCGCFECNPGRGEADPPAGGSGAPPGVSSGPVRYATGEVSLRATDLASNSFGLPWGHTRSFSSRLSINETIGNGFNWRVAQWPLLVFPNSQTIVVEGQVGESLWFDLVGHNYVPRFTVKSQIVHDSIAKVYRLTDLNGVVTEFDDYSGMFLRRFDSAGNRIAVTAWTANSYNFTDVERTYVSGGNTTTEQYHYDYDTKSGDHLLSSVTLRRKVNNGAWINSQKAVYTYYLYNEPYGGEEDLKTVTTQSWQGGAWVDTGTSYYRYYLAPSSSSSSSSSSSGSSSSPGGSDPLRLLKYVVNPASFARLAADPHVSNPLTASDGIVAQYADYFYSYDSSRRVTFEMVQGGSRSFSFAYSQSAFSDDYNHWKTKTVETLPDSTQQIIYANFAGRTMLSVHKSGSDIWCDFYQYNSAGQLILHAHPSAISGYDETYADLLHQVGGNYEFLKDHQGLIETYEIHAPTGRISSEKIQQGEFGTCIRLRDLEYTAFYANVGAVALISSSSSSSSASSGSSSTPSGMPVYFLTKQSVYPDDGCGCDCNSSSSSSSSSCSLGRCCSNDGTRQIVTAYSYTFYSGTTQVKQKTTTLPAIPVDQNGSGVAATRKEYFDSFNNLIWTMDERGFITGVSYDIPTGAMTRRIDDVDTSLVTAPSGWTTPSGGGLHLITDFEHDDQGRITQTLGPSHTIDLNGTATVIRRATWNVYQDSTYQRWSAQGFATGNSPSNSFTLINPVSISQMDASGRVLEQISAARASTSGKLQSTDSFPQSTYVRWTTNQYTDCCLAASQRVYHTIPTSGTGSSGTNYDETDYGYDAMKRQARTVTPGGTITYRVFDVRGQVTAVYVGTNDTGATDQDPTGGGAVGNNMVVVTENQFDGGVAGGDGNLTVLTQHVDDSTSRLTSYLYDWRDRRIATDGEIDFYETACYDNLNRVLRTDRRDTTASGALINRSETKYDDQSRGFRSIRFAVNPATGAIGNSLTDNTWYDARGNVIKSQSSGSQLFIKTTYDSLKRATISYNGYDLDETSYAEVGRVTDDVILTQTETVFDAASSSIQSTVRHRYHNAPASQLGSLNDPSTAPKARVLYSATWPDAIGRAQATADYGTNGGIALSRPSTIPARSDTVLVTSVAYDASGNAVQMVDQGGMITRFAYDAVGRELSQIANYVANSSSSSSSSGSGCSASSDQNVTTLTTYNADGNIATLTALNASTGSQTTQYVYGTTLSDSGIASSVLKRKEIYPDSLDSIDVILFAYNRQSDVKQMTDQAGTVHQYEFDLLGRQTQDRITTLGTAVDGAVRRIETTFEVRGMKAHLASYDNSTVGSGTVVNDCQYVYNDFSQLTTEYQSHSGAVSTGTTPKVQYAFANGSANTIRATSMTYPNGRVLTYSYGATNGIDDSASRVTSLIDNDGTTRLADYSYLGLRVFVETDSTQPDVKYTLIGTAGGNDPDTGDIYRGLDRFGRIKDSYWYNYGTSTDADRIKYGYDRIGNRLYRESTVATAAGAKFDELYQYDAIHRLQQMDRGTLNGAKTVLSVETFAQCWTLDETGNWRGFRQDDTGDGIWDLIQSRTSNPVNEISDISETAGSSWATPIYSRPGNMTTIPQPLAPTTSYGATYDAWNRLVKLVSGANTVSEYQYDGATRRIVRKSYAAGALSETRHLYYTQPAQWQVIEERLGTSPSSANPNRQFVWGSRYIDDIVLRDRDTNGDGTLDERLYALQDANWNVTSLVNASGSIQERMAYTAYGEPRFLSPTWTTQADGFNWEILYTGYRYEAAVGLLLVRNRWLNPTLGGWCQRDPRRYHDGSNLYCLYFVPNRSDPFGLAGGSTESGSGKYEEPPEDKFTEGSCSIRTRCYAVVAEPFFGFGLGTHCGLIMTVNGVDYSIDGTGGSENNFDWQSPPYNPSRVWEGGSTDFPLSKCECLREKSVNWNKQTIPRKTIGKNSNWSLGCLVDKCNITINWGSQGAPYNYNEQCCRTWEPINGISIDGQPAYICRCWERCKCPDV